MIWCPRCEQGWVVKCRVVGTEETFGICEECDTVWAAEEPSSRPPFTILDEYMEKFGKAPLWSNLERLEKGTETAS
ncbi:hypothetical protein GCM10010230_33300 [Streptomyces narbonensis]|nr:hypothetical protein GCM10010230_33300 [Streptomyces narbonensis]